MSERPGEPRPSEAAIALARRFHETYERLAPQFGYETRRDSAVPWEQVPIRNRQLMVAVCEELLARGGSGPSGADPATRGPLVPSPLWDALIAASTNLLQALPEQVILDLPEARMLDETLACIAVQDEQEEIIHIDDEGRVRKSTVLLEPEREGPCVAPSGADGARLAGLLQELYHGVGGDTITFEDAATWLIARGVQFTAPPEEAEPTEEGSAITKLVSQLAACQAEKVRLAAGVPSTAPCPYVRTSGEGTSYCALAATAPTAPPGISLSAVRLWLKGRPGTSWLASLKDIDEAVIALTGAAAPPVVETRIPNEEVK